MYLTAQLHTTWTQFLKEGAQHGDIEVPKKITQNTHEYGSTLHLLGLSLLIISGSSMANATVIIFTRKPQRKQITFSTHQIHVMRLTSD